MATPARRPGACAHIATTAPCDDGDFGTVLDRCSAGACGAADRLPLSKVKLRLIIRPGPQDGLLVKAEAPLEAVQVTPAQNGFLLALRSDAGSILYHALLPSTAWTDVRNHGKVFRFKDRKAEIPEAAGIRTATVKRVDSRQVFRLKLRAKKVELDTLGDHNRLSLSSLFGEVPGSGPCVSAQAIPCRVRGAKILCE